MQWGALRGYFTDFGWKCFTSMCSRSSSFLDRYSSKSLSGSFCSFCGGGGLGPLWMVKITKSETNRTSQYFTEEKNTKRGWTHSKILLEGRVYHIPFIAVICLSSIWPTWCFEAQQPTTSPEDSYTYGRGDIPIFNFDEADRILIATLQELIEVSTFGQTENKF